MSGAGEPVGGETVPLGKVLEYSNTPIGVLFGDALEVGEE